MRYEYKLVYQLNHPLRERGDREALELFERQLNELGVKGWEVVECNLKSFMALMKLAIPEKPRKK